MARPSRVRGCDHLKIDVRVGNSAETGRKNRPLVRTPEVTKLVDGNGRVFLSGVGFQSLRRLEMSKSNPAAGRKDPSFEAGLIDRAELRIQTTSPVHYLSHLRIVPPEDESLVVRIPEILRDLEQQTVGLSAARSAAIQDLARRRSKEARLRSRVGPPSDRTAAPCRFGNQGSVIFS